MATFEIKAQRQANKMVIHLVGVIDEDADFSTCNLQGQTLVELDLVEVKGINSCGIREWIKWMSAAPGAEFVLLNCPKVIVDQINMVDGFLPVTGKVRSFYVPYYSEESSEERNVLFRYGTEYDDTGLHLPGDIKDSDGNPMEMDVLEARYFKFLKKAA